MKNAFATIQAVVEQHYKMSEYPALAHQIAQWGKERPLQGLRLLDATPVFRNTMTKYLALMAAGADLTVGISELMPCDVAVVDFLRDSGVEVVIPEEAVGEFDLVLDCAGSFAAVHARLGYVELTRSGVEHYEHCQKPVYVADSGKIKQIETMIGTGESLFRALKQLGYDGWRGGKIVLFGSGKVGNGIILHAYNLGAQVTVVTDPATLSYRMAWRAKRVVNYRDKQAVADAVVNAALVVTATGHKEAIGDGEVARRLVASSSLLANMGVEDEFGAYVPTSRVLNGKKPLNFILAEPTHLKYIETTMALHNLGAHYLVTHPEARGMILPSQQSERALLQVVRRDGVIASELGEIEVD